ncbi:MAG TPA: transglutaminase-like domain-containing protein, partial [Candidatus Dormibacteraeota bacterium]|nr:transglutaminase-like domain-containing protein [Candidatus Dormibacteraeota bacterium]
MDPDPSLADFTAAVTRADADIPLARAALLIAAAEQPALDVDKELARLDDLAEAAAPRGGQDELRRLHRLREFLFEEQGFAGDRGDYFDPRNSYLNHVLDRRLGIPITLSLVLIEVGRRLGLDMEGVGLPGHFITGIRIGGEHVLLDPFNRGAL